VPVSRVAVPQSERLREVDSPVRGGAPQTRANSSSEISTYGWMGRGPRLMRAPRGPSTPRGGITIGTLPKGTGGAFGMVPRFLFRVLVRGSWRTSPVRLLWDRVNIVDGPFLRNRGEKKDVSAEKLSKNFVFTF
jgi:hypothetical protein